MARVMDKDDRAYRVQITVVRRWSNPNRARMEFCYYGPFMTLGQARGIRTRKVKEFSKRGLEILDARVDESTGWSKVVDNARNDWRRSIILPDDEEEDI